MQNLQQLETEAPIIQQTLGLYKELYEQTKKFPKKDQYLLGRRCEDTLLSFLEYTLLAANVPKDQKVRLLNIAAGKFDVIDTHGLTPVEFPAGLKVLLRLAQELRMLDKKQYILLEIKVREIGKMLGGWIRSLPIQAR